MCSNLSSTDGSVLDLQGCNFSFLNLIRNKFTIDDFGIPSIYGSYNVKTIQNSYRVHIELANFDKINSSPPKPTIFNLIFSIPYMCESHRKPMSTDGHLLVKFWTSRSLIAPHPSPSALGSPQDPAPSMNKCRLTGLHHWMGHIQSIR